MITWSVSQLLGGKAFERTGRALDSMGAHPVVCIVIVFLLLLLPHPGCGQRQASPSDPLPLAVAASLRGHVQGSPIGLSPDGEWLAHTIQVSGLLPEDSLSFLHSPTGVPGTAGPYRLEATLTHTLTGESIRLGAGSSTTWAPVWSPDGSRAAFFSDEGGEAGLWIWERKRREASRIPGVIVRPYLGLEAVSWSPDGRRLLVKVLPEAMTLADANARDPWHERRFPTAGPGEPSVLVRRADPVIGAGTELPGRYAGDPMNSDVEWTAADLAAVNVDSGEVVRLVRALPIRWYAWSPDGQSVAFSRLRTAGTHRPHPDYDIVIVNGETGEMHTMIQDVPMSLGIEWSWGPGSEILAYLETGRGAGEGVVLVSVADGQRKRVVEESMATPPEGLAPFGQATTSQPPLWSGDGSNLFVVGGGDLWRVDVRSGIATSVLRESGWEMTAIVSPFGKSVVWSTDGGRVLWVIAKERDTESSGIFSVDVVEERMEVVLHESRIYSTLFNLSASEKTATIAFVSESQTEPQDIWLLDTGTRELRRGTVINPELEDYEFGSAQILEWRSLEGEPLQGALLLPPGYREGQRVPLVVFVYGGSMGSAFANRFGFWGSPQPAVFNMQVLATRGYAVLFPDAPLREGRAMRDILHTVLPGVNAAVEAGFADSDRVAVMGQSYGAYSTLSLITQTHLFRAAVITAAGLHPDLVASYLSQMWYYERGHGNMGVTIWDDWHRYFENSPIFHFPRITTPLLIGHGEEDYGQFAAEAIFAALERLEKTVEFRLYRGEAHTIRREVNVVDFWERRLDFLAEHLDVARDVNGRVLLEGERAQSKMR